jgi:hypothetical protein
MANTPSLLLYSTNTHLAFLLNEHYYRKKHWVWCNPYFDDDAATAAGFTSPPSSTPIELYQAYAEAVRRQDRHSPIIKQNRTNLMKGARAVLKAGVITQAQFANINAIVKKAQLDLFRPLIYVIPYAAVANKVVSVPVTGTASFFSPEFQIHSLDRSEFDIIKF